MHEQTVREIIAEFAGDNPKLSTLLTQVVYDIEADRERFLGQDISVIINQMRYAVIDAEIRRYKEENKEPLPKFKFRKMMIEEFKNALMPEIAPLID